jgi:hypothetical protein
MEVLENGSLFQHNKVVCRPEDFFFPKPMGLLDLMV